MEVQAAVCRSRSRPTSENGLILREAGEFSSAPRQGESTVYYLMSCVAEVSSAPLHDMLRGQENMKVCVVFSTRTRDTHSSPSLFISRLQAQPEGRGLSRQQRQLET